MARLQLTITIVRPIADVYAVLTDVEQTGTWFPGDVEEHWTSPPPHGVGSTRHAVVTMLGRRSENDAVITAYDPPHVAALRGTSPGAPFDATLTFAEAAEGTRVDVDIELAFTGPRRLIGPPFATWYRRQWAKGLVTARRMMEHGEL